MEDLNNLKILNFNKSENNLDLQDHIAVAFVLKKPFTSTNTTYEFSHKKQNLTGIAIPIILDD